MIAHAAQRSLVQQAQALRICRHNVDFKVQVRRLAHMAPKVAAIAAAPVGAEPEAAEEERTLALLKPDLLADPGMVAQVLAEIRLQQGITIVQHKELQWTEDDASKFYAEHQGRFFYERLVGYMSSGPLVALELQGFGVISRWRALLGAAKPAHMRVTNPNCLRARYGLTDTRNAFHGSDSIESAQRELALVFGTG